MTIKKLEVPFVTQIGIGGHVVGGTTHDDPTGCWFASACMVAYFFEKGPRKGNPALFQCALPDGRLGHFATGSPEANHIDPNHHEYIANKEQLEPVPDCNTDHNYTLEEVETLLQRGPIFMYWMKPCPGREPYGHASVIIGVQDAVYDDGTSNQEIVYHDPESAPDSRMSIADFNARRQKWFYALMRRKADAVGQTNFTLVSG